MTEQVRLYPNHERCVGVHPHGPAKCIGCRQLFEAGEHWLRLISDTDPALGSYTIGIHESCAPQINAGANARRTNTGSKRTTGK